MNLKSICLIAAAAFVSLRVALPRLTSRLGARCRPSARGCLEMGAGIISLIKTLCRDHLEWKAALIFEPLGRRKPAVLCAGRFYRRLAILQPLEINVFKMLERLLTAAFHRTERLSYSPCNTSASLTGS